MRLQNNIKSTKDSKVVEEVDQKLVELTNQIMNEEKEGLEVLAIVGEIKGLIISLYT